MIHFAFRARRTGKEKLELATKKSSRGRGKVRKVMHEYKTGELKSGSGRKVASKKQAVAIALNEAREAGAKIPRKGAAKKKAASKKTAAKKSTARKTGAKRTGAKKAGAKRASKKSR